MKPNLRTLLAGLSSAAVLFLAACGGGGDGDTPAASPAPTAVAAADQTRVPIGTLVTLDGSGSSAAAGGTLTYQWSLAGKPADSAAALSDAAAAKPSFTPDRPGEYVANLVVQSGSASSAHVRVSIVAVNLDPVAVITTQNQGVLLGSAVVLDGSASLPPTDAAASELRYEWRLTSQPQGGRASLRDAATAKASFIAATVGIYRATLVVHHGTRSSAPLEAVVTVNTSNASPVARVGVPTSVVRGANVVLDGSASIDANGDALSYRWAFPQYNSTGGNSMSVPPRASTATIRNATSAVAEFTPDAVGNYDVILTVYDGSVASTQKVTVAVTKPQGAANIAPVAVIGTGAATVECEIGGYCGFSSSASYDADGDALTGSWTYWNTATPSDRTTVAGRDLYALSYGAAAATYQVQFVVNDGKVDSAAATQTLTVKSGANVPAQARVTVDRGTVMAGETITFDGSGSTDRNGDQMSYQWTLIDRPNGSSAVLQNATSAKALVVADRPGPYVAMLKVTDSKGASWAMSATSFGTVFAKASNNAPVVANAWIGQDGALEGQPIVLRDDGTAALQFSAQVFDPDLDAPLYYIISATKQPAGSSAIAAMSSTTRSGATVEFGAVPPIAPGEYEFEALVSDGNATSQPVRRSATVVTRANYPTLLVETASGFPQQGSVPEALPDPGSYWQRKFPVQQFTEDFDDVYAGSGGFLGFTYWYRLTAADRDYTITGLQATSSKDGYVPTFRGLQNGQVIRKGQTIEFTFERPRIANEAELANGLSAIDQQFGNQSDEYKAESARLQKLLADYQFTWSFRIAEKDGFTFYAGPRR